MAVHIYWYCLFRNEDDRACVYTEGFIEVYSSGSYTSNTIRNDDCRARAGQERKESGARPCVDNEKPTRTKCCIHHDAAHTRKHKVKVPVYSKLDRTFMHIHTRRSSSCQPCKCFSVFPFLPCSSSCITDRYDAKAIALPPPFSGTPHTSPTQPSPPHMHDNEKRERHEHEA